ncbi:MAG: sigma-70 family RNA polymerase sigma factor [Planctomycetota bacterium]
METPAPKPRPDADIEALETRALGGDQAALADAFMHYRPKLRGMVSLRLDPRLRGRLNASDVLQESFIELTEQLPEFSKKPNLPVYLWMRLVTSRRLAQLHRKYLDTAKRNAALEVSIQHGGAPEASGFDLASKLLGNWTSVSQKAMVAEARAKLQDVINTMDSMDREILALRDFEELSNKEVAIVLGIESSAASKRHIAALQRLATAVREIPGFVSES